MSRGGGVAHSWRPPYTPSQGEGGGGGAGRKFLSASFLSTLVAAPGLTKSAHRASGIALRCPFKRQPSRPRNGAEHST